MIELQVACGPVSLGDWSTPTAAECARVAIDAWRLQQTLGGHPCFVIPRRWETIMQLMLAGV